MKTRTKLLTVWIVVLIGVAVGVVSFRREMRIYHNQRLVKLIYEYWEIEDREIKRVGEKATRLLLPEITCEVPGLLKGRRFYFCLDDFNRTGKYIDLMVKSEERIVFNPFRVEYNVFKPPSDIIRYERSDFNQDYLGCGYFDSKYNDLESEEEKKIKEKSEEILKIAEEKFESSLLCYQERKNQEQEFIRESQKLGLKLFQVSKILNNQIKAIESSTKTLSRGYYSFTIQSEKFERVTWTFFYDPDPDFEIVRLELGELPEQKCFDVRYDIDYNYSKWGLINNEGVTLGSFELLSDVLRLIEERIKEDPEIVKAALLEKSVK